MFIACIQTDQTYISKHKDISTGKDRKREPYTPAGHKNTASKC